MSDSRAVDRESRRLIREELLTNILVEAGAGSGKTQMLAERMAAGVAAGVYQVEHMAAVTFTRKAASELRGRFHLALEAELLKARNASNDSMPSRDERIARIQTALSNLERFFAGTIHSFCARLLRERPVESGVSPGFSELDEVQDLELRQRVWRDFITNARAAGDPNIVGLLAAEVQPRDLDSAFAVICINEDVDFPPGDGECPDPRKAWNGLEKFWTELQKHLPATIHPDTTCKIQKAARQFQGDLRVSRYRLDRPSVMAQLLDNWDGESKIVQKWWAKSRAEQQRLRDLVQGLHAEFKEDVVEPWLALWRQYVYRLSVTLLTRARAFAAAERRRLNSLNYGDLLNVTARVLRENESVRRALQEKYRHILVDEFQDTDPVQAEIVFLLAADEAPVAKPFNAAAVAPIDWRRLTLRPGALFVVGDPKQSIYRFRRADIDIYNLVRARFSDPSVGRVVPLTKNFRSVSPLCSWANEVFKTRFPAEATDYSPRFAALDAEESSTKPGGVFTLTYSCDFKDIPAQDAQRIATYIRSEVDAGRRHFSDFLILTRKKRNRIAPYVNALEALNIPIEASGAGAFGESPQVETLTVLLRALSDPQDALSLVTLLRGPFFGISDPELFAFKQSGGWFSVFGGQKEREGVSQAEPPTVDRVTAALSALGSYYRWTRVLPAAAALDRILEHTGYLSLAATTPGGVDAGDILHAVDRVRQVVEEGGSLADAADSLEADADANEVESLPLEPGRTDVVRVMNLHKAKGLEADVVFLADPAGGVGEHIDVHIERTGAKAVGWLKVARKIEGQFNPKLLGEHKDWPTHENAERPYLQHEEDRLVYVAATRARQMLIVSRSIDAPRSPAWGALNPFLAQATELRVPQSVTVSPVAPLDCTAATRTTADDQQKAAHALVNQPSWSVTSVTAEARHVARITRAVDASADDPSKVVATNTQSHRADTGQAWGTLIHGLLEHAMRHESATLDDLRRLATWLTVEEPQLRLAIGDALDTVERVVRTDFWPQAHQHERSVEAPFVVAGTGRRLTSGIIDLLFQSPQGWHIIDYKTDVNLSAHKHDAQIAAYRNALCRMGYEIADSTAVSVRSQDEESVH